jgi:hypothetical protein
MPINPEYLIPAFYTGIIMLLVTLVNDIRSRPFFVTTPQGPYNPNHFPNQKDFTEDPDNYYGGEKSILTEHNIEVINDFLYNNNLITQNESIDVCKIYTELTNKEDKILDMKDLENIVNIYADICKKITHDKQHRKRHNNSHNKSHNKSRGGKRRSRR